MNDFQSTPLETDNPEPRCPVVLLLDRSGSMSGAPIQQLNNALVEFKEDVSRDALASLRVEVAIVAFGGSANIIDIKQEPGKPLADDVDASMAFSSVLQMQTPVFTADGLTPMGAAVEISLRLIRERKDQLKKMGLSYYRPLMLLITDAKPTDDEVWPNAAEHLKREEARNGVVVFGVGVEGADMSILSKFTSQYTPLKLRGLAFNELFLWLTGTIKSVTSSQPGGQAPLPPVTWAQVDTSST